MSSRWQEVWSQPTPEVSRRGEKSSLGDLIIADGYNTGYGDLEVDAWRDFVDRTCDLFELGAGDSLFDVGCGAGAFLHPAQRHGVRVGGIDYSPSRIELARRAMPEGRFELGEAIELDVKPPAEVVLSFGVFFYFPSLDYAREVIARMCQKATCAVGVFEAYSERYAGLDHLSFSQDWMASTLADNGLRDVTVQPQDIRGYGNGRFRFNAWGWVPDAQ